MNSNDILSIVASSIILILIYCIGLVAHKWISNMYLYRDPYRVIKSTTVQLYMSALQIIYVQHQKRRDCQTHLSTKYERRSFVYKRLASSCCLYQEMNNNTMESRTNNATIVQRNCFACHSYGYAIFANPIRIAVDTAAISYSYAFSMPLRLSSQFDCQGCPT
jgi:hypothetical protein